MSPLFNFDSSLFNPGSKPPRLVLLVARWMICRLMLGAGLIKIRGDQCWRDLTCMKYHYETQPVPNPISPFLHFNPMPYVHQLETLANHFVELVVPAFLMLGGSLRRWAGFIQVLFQVILIISGNLSFLNWLTIAPAICCLDDQFILKFFPFNLLRKKVERCRKMELTKF